MASIKARIAEFALNFRAFISRPEFIFPILLLLYLFVISLNAWTGDDSYITFRTVDNFIHGYGLRWNVGERVQSFTHPLWLFCLIIFSFFSSDIWIAAITLSITISLLTFSLIIFNSRLSYLTRVLVALTLICSKAFVEYSTSGLENPLTHLLLTLFFLIALDNNRPRSSLRVIALLVALLATNRIDSVLIPLPLFALRLYQDIRTRAFSLIICDLIIGFLPFLLWEIFSLTYYGFLAPNTAYAKLGAAQEKSYLIVHGILYLCDSIIRDPVTVFGILSGVAWIVPARSRSHLLAIIGPALYVVYVINIGGDFMSGRFLTAPLISSLLIGAAADPQIRVPVFQRSLTACFSACIYTIALSQSVLFSLCPDSREIKGFPLFGVNDEAHYYRETNSLARRLLGASPADHQWAREGMSLRRSGGTSTVIHGNIGLLGYYAGPRVTIIDFYALSDPLLARLPARFHRGNMIGHFARDLPGGYLESTAMQSNVVSDRNLSHYYGRLDLITRGNLFSLDRLMEIVRFNTGTYNKFREYYTIGDLISRINGGETSSLNQQFPCVSSHSWGDNVERPLLPECGISPTPEQQKSFSLLS